MTHEEFFERLFPKIVTELKRRNPHLKVRYGAWMVIADQHGNFFLTVAYYRDSSPRLAVHWGHKEAVLKIEERFIDLAESDATQQLETIIKEAGLSFDAAKLETG